MPQITLTTAFQDVASLGARRELYLSGADPGTVVAVEAGASLGATDGVEIGRLTVPDPGVVGAEGTTVLPYPGGAQFLRYRVVEGTIGTGVVWMSGSAAGAPPQIALTDTFQDFSSLGAPREVFLAGAPDGTVVAVEAGDSLVATAGAEVSRLFAPNPSVATAAGTLVGYAGSAQFLRYRVTPATGGPFPGSGIWVAGAQPDETPGFGALAAGFAAASSLLDASTQYVPPGSGNATDLALWFGGVIIPEDRQVQKMLWSWIGDLANNDPTQTIAVAFQASTDGGLTWGPISGAAQVGLHSNAGAHFGDKAFAAVTLSAGTIVRAGIRPNAALTTAITNIVLGLE